MVLKTQSSCGMNNSLHASVIVKLLFVTTNLGPSVVFKGGVFPYKTQTKTVETNLEYLSCSECYNWQAVAVMRWSRRKVDCPHNCSSNSPWAANTKKGNKCQEKPTMWIRCHDSKGGIFHSCPQVQTWRSRILCKLLRAASEDSWEADGNDNPVQWPHGRQLSCIQISGRKDYSLSRFSL